MSYKFEKSELSDKLREDIVFNSDEIIKPAEIEIQGRTLVNLLGRAGNPIYRQDVWVNCGTETSHTFDGDSIKMPPMTYGYLRHTGVTMKPNSYFIFLADHTPGVDLHLGTDTPFGTVSKRETNPSAGRSLLAFNSGATDIVYYPCLIIQMGSTIDTYIKNIRMYEITKEIYDKISIDPEYSGLKVFEKYPYVDDVKCVVNPYIECVENLINRPWVRGTFDTATGLGLFGTGHDNTRCTCDISIETIPGEKYSFNFEGLNDNKKLIYRQYQGFAQPIGGNVTQNLDINKTHTFTAVGNFIRFSIGNIGDTAIDIDEVRRCIPTLVMGNMPKSHNECHNSRIMFETKLYDGETISRRNDGTYVKNSDWEEVTLNNLSFGYNDMTPTSGFKYFSTPNIIGTASDYIIIKYDGKILPKGTWYDKTKENFYFGAGHIGIALPNILTGWGDAYTPTIDEIRAFFLGWRMSQKNTGGQPYNNTGVKEWTKLWCGFGKSVAYGGALCIDASNIETTPTTMNNMAYTPYKVIYKKTSPEVKTIETHGALYIKENIKVSANSGLVLGEPNNGYTLSGKVYFNDTITGLPSNRVERTLAITTLDTNSNMFFTEHDFSFSDSSNERIKRGIRQSRWDFNGSNQFALVDYLIYFPDTVSSYNFNIDIANDIKVSIDEIQNNLIASENNLELMHNKLKYATNELKRRNNPNLLINGDFQVWQRGVSFSATTTSVFYLADRWHILNQNAKCIVNKLDRGGIYIKRYEPTDTATVTRITQFFEANTLKASEDRTYTFTVKYNLKNTDNLFLYVNLSDVGLRKVSLPATSKEFIFTFTIPADTSLRSLFIQNTGEFEIEIYSMKLEIGNMSTPLVPRSYYEELALCEKYYQVLRLPTSFTSHISNVSYVPIAGGAIKSSIAVFSTFNFKEMRIAPTLKYIVAHRNSGDYDLSIAKFPGSVASGTGNLLSYTVSSLGNHVNLVFGDFTDTTFVDGKLSAHIMLNGSGKEGVTRGLKDVHLDAEIYSEI